MKKSIFLFFAAILCATSAWGQAQWIGNSYIVVNGQWYASTSFNTKNLGEITSLTLGGQVQTWGQSDGANNPAKMYYQIKDQNAVEITMPWLKYESSNNFFESLNNTVDISSLAAGEYTLSVWFHQPDGGQWDSNGGNNYVATFTIAAAGEEPDPTPDPAETETVYFVNADDWTGTIYAYAYANGGSTKNAEWPGEVAQKEANPIGGHDVYSYTAEKGKYENVIFNNKKDGGNQQTADLAWTAGKYYVRDNWYTEEAAAEALAAPVVNTYTVVGSSAPLFGETWTPAKAENDMTLVEGTKYELVKTDVSLTGGEIQYKVAVNHAWDEAYPGDNAILDIAEAGKYTVTFTFDSDTKAVNATAELIEAAVVLPTVGVKGAWDGWATTTTLTGDNTSASAIVNIATAGVYEFGLDVDGNFQASGATIDKANNSTVVTTNAGNMKLTANVLGDYTFTWTYETKTLVVTYPAGEEVEITKKYYIAGTENLTGFNWQADGLEIAKVGDVYKHTFSEMNAGTYEFKITDGTWTNPWGFSNLAANYVGVEQGKDGEGNYNGNIKIVTEEAKNIIVIFDPANNKITLEGWEEAAPAEDVTVYFINSGNWAKVACYYWGGTNAPAWPGVEMTANGEVYEAEGWNVYKVTFPGDNTSCIFNDNKAEGATQTGNLEVHDGQYYCYENGIWYERLADVDPLDTRIYLKGQMNDWCAEYCDMFRKETIDGTVAYRTLYLEEANTTYEFKIESAGAWLSCAQAVTKDNCTDLTFEEGGNNCTITTEYVGEYTFVWDMTTNKLSVVYPDPKANPTVLDLMVTNMEFDGETFSGSDNTYGIALNLVVGEAIEEGVFALDASSTVDFGGTLFTEVTGMIAPDVNTFASATAQVSGFYMGTYFQLNVQMSAGGSAATPVEIWDGVATPNDATGELTISANWDGDDVYVVVPGFDYTNYECDEVWFYIGGTTWETASIAAYGPATITVEDGGVLVEGTVISGITGTQYELMVFGSLPVEETPDYTRAVASGSYGTICLPNGSSKVEGAKFYEVTYKKDGHIYADEVTTLVAGMPYIFQATSTEIKVYYNETTAAAGSNNGVYGTFSDITDGDAGTAGNVLEGKYLLVAGPKVQKCGGNCSLAANRAYFVVDEITTQEKQEIPGRQRIALGCQEENQATGLDNITENGIVAPAMQGTYDILGRQLSEPAANGFYIINGKKMFVVK